MGLGAALRAKWRHRPPARFSCPPAYPVGATLRLVPTLVAINIYLLPKSATALALYLHMTPHLPTTLPARGPLHCFHLPTSCLSFHLHYAASHLLTHGTVWYRDTILSP